MISSDRLHNNRIDDKMTKFARIDVDYVILQEGVSIYDIILNVTNTE